MRRFRLISLLVAMLTASVLIGVNMRGQFLLDPSPNPFRNPSVELAGEWNYGWPATIYSYRANAILWKDVPADKRAEFEVFVAEQTKIIDEGKRDGISKVLKRADGVYSLESDPEFRRWAIAVDVLAVIAIILFALVMTELLCIGTNERRERIRRCGQMRVLRIRLISIAAGFILAGGGVVLNVRGQWSDSSFTYGWPFPITFVAVTDPTDVMPEAAWNDFSRNVEWNGKSIARRDKHGKVRVFRMNVVGPVDYSALGMNVLALFGSFVVALVTSEFLLRRRDERVKLEGSE